MAVVGALLVTQQTQAQNQPSLTIQTLPNQGIKLSWPGSASGFILQQASELGASNTWQIVPQPLSLAASNYSVALDGTTHSRYFRLLLPPPPANPISVASPLRTDTPTDLGSATAFLYTGPNPIQIGVTNGTIAPTRAAVLRVKVTLGDGTPLSGVIMTILGHPELGLTQTRADGMFDLAVNGGGMLAVKYEKSGYCPAQRQVTVPLQDYTTLPDVVMMPMDAVVTAVTFGTNAPLQVHRASVQTDQDGTRQATLIFPPGTAANVVMPNGALQPMSALNVRATEFTVGTNGPAAMPAQLPPTSAYTYCAELSADEAVNAGATSVQFNQPVGFYVENFLKFPVGTAVPVGYYDRQQGVWVASDNGVVLKILSLTAGRADLDTDGDGVADSANTLAALGITDAERQQLAALYPVGKTLWRASLAHFTAIDLNFAVMPPPDAQPPQMRNGPIPPPDGTCHAPGSVIEAQAQVLGEDLNLVGIPFGLHYRSDRVAGHKTGYDLPIALSGANLPASLERIDLQIQVAGRAFSYSTSPATNLTYTFHWDGLDAYGRALPGRQPAAVDICYWYRTYYQTTRRFGYAGAGLPITVDGQPVVSRFANWLNGICSACPNWFFFVGFVQHFDATVGAFDARGMGLGAWTLDVQHVYDPGGKILYLGDGTQRTAANLNETITTIAGGGVFSGTALVPSLEGKPMLQVYIGGPRKALAAPDGSLYLLLNDGSANCIVRADPKGILHSFMGGYGNSPADGIPATNAVSEAVDMALGPDGLIYYASLYGRVRRVERDGTVTTIAGTGGQCPPGTTCGVGGPARQAAFGALTSIAVGSDGTVYVGDRLAHRVFSIGTDGILNSFAGTGLDPGAFNFPGATNCIGQSGQWVCGDGGPATQASLTPYGGLAAGPDGSVYINVGNALDRVGSDGILRVVISQWHQPILTGEGIPVGNESPGNYDIAVGPDGSLYYTAGLYDTYVRRVGTDGLVTTAAGQLPFIPYRSPGFAGDGGPATQALLNRASSATVGPDGSVYIADYENLRIRRVGHPFPGFTASDLVIASADGGQFYIFDAQGRHLATKHGLTGATLYQFTYGAAGRLVQVQDVNGNVTAIQHDASGNPTAIVGPYGQTTTLTTDANGYLASVRNPAGDTVQLTSTADGLLTSLTDPKGNTHHHAYDSVGRLMRDDDPAGGFTALARVDNGTRSYTVTSSNALGRVTSYEVDQLDSGERRQANTFPDGTQTTLVVGTDQSYLTLTPDGMTISALQGLDPRFAMQAPLNRASSVTTPSGLTFNTGETSVAVLTDSSDPFSLVTLTNTTALNTNVFSSFYTAATRTFTNTTPQGRQTISTIDAQGRVVQAQTAGLLPVIFSYDSRGRLQGFVQGSGPTARTNTFNYDGNGYLAATRDPLGRTNRLTYDAAGRALSQTFPDGRVVSFAYDLNGNLTSLTPPGRPAHQFSYTPIDFVGAYVPPDVGAGSNQTLYLYDTARELARVTRPDGKTVDFDYVNGACNCGRLNSVTIARGTVSYGYDAVTGNLTNILAPGGLGLGFKYDGSLPLSTVWSGAVTGSVQRAYDNFLRVAARSVNGSNTVNFAYDNDGLLAQGGALALSRDPQNGLLLSTALDGVTNLWNYNGFGETTNYAVTYNGAVLFSVAYQRDGLGRISSKAEIIGGTTDSYAYAYDLAGRLVQVQKSAAAASSYRYDSNGNILGYTNQSGSFAATYDNQDRLLQAGNATYTYTANGELTSKTVGGQATSYQYDELGNLLHVALPDGTQIDYVIDGRNRRIGKKINGTLVQGFLYESDLRPIAELDGSNNVVSRFVYGTGVNVPEYMIKGGATCRIVTDHLGSPRLVVDVQSGAVTERLDYDEFGKVLLDTNPGLQPFGFAGGLHDADTALVRFGVRDYDPAVGRWTSKDPLRQGGGDLNFLAYVQDDPINKVGYSGAQDAFGNLDMGNPLGMGPLPQLQNALGTLGGGGPTPGPQPTSCQHVDLNALTLEYEREQIGRQQPPEQLLLRQVIQMTDRQQLNPETRQKLLEMLSNMVKSMHDMKAAPIRNLRG